LENISIHFIGDTEFKTNKKSSLFYVKEFGGKFIRVSHIEYMKRQFNIAVENKNAKCTTFICTSS